MIYVVSDLYDTGSVRGPRNVCFQDIAVSGSDAGPHAAFVQLKDTYMRGEERLQQAIKLGTRIFIGNHFPEELQAEGALTLVHVEDPLAELIRLTAMLRSDSHATFIAVTGSSGKTTTKDMIAHLLRGRHRNTLKTFRNYNGLLGIPLTLRRLRPDDRYAVLEIGLGDPGSVARGAALVRPHVSVVTNVGESHIGRFRDLPTIAREKSAILHHIPSGGLAVLNGDDPYCREMQTACNAEVMFFGRGADCHVRILSTRQVSYDRLNVTMACSSGEIALELNAVGDFQAYNAAAAVAVALHEDLHPEEIGLRLTSFRTGEQRMKTYVRGDLLVVDDGYNASPQGVRVAIAAFAQIPWPGVRVLILGDPQDQGDLSGHYLAELADIAVGSRHDLVIWLGGNVAGLEAAVAGSRHAVSVEEAAETALGATRKGGAILIKGTEDRLLKALRMRLLL